MSLLDNIQCFLASYRSLSLEKTEAAKLIHRMETKYVIRSDEYARLTASWRTRMQLILRETDKPRGNLFDDDSYKWVWRNRFGLKYNIKGVPLKPYANIEQFYQLFSDLETAAITKTDSALASNTNLPNNIYSKLVTNSKTKLTDRKNTKTILSNSDIHTLFNIIMFAVES